MSDLQKYIERRKRESKEFAKEFDEGYEDFSIGTRLRQSREQAGLTQEEIARKLQTQKSTISRIENHSEDIRLSILRKYARALGKKLDFKII